MIVLYIIIGLIALLFVVGLFSRKDYSLARGITINRPNSDVFNYIKHLRHQDHFNKWVMRDPDMKKEFRGTDGTEGFVYGWNGNKQAGEGEQRIMKIDEGKRIDIEIRFIRPFAAIAQAPFTTEAISANQTRLTWAMSSRMNYPMNIVLLFMSEDKLLGKDMETSLGILKNILEKS